MSQAIHAKILAQLSDSLNNEELGAAVRILVRLIERGEPLPLRNLHIVAGVGKNEWTAMQDAVCSGFVIENEHVTLENWIHTIKPASRKTPTKTSPEQESMFESLARIVTTPAPKAARTLTLDSESNKTTRHLHTEGVELFERNGYTKMAAQRAVGRLIKTYSAEHLLGAIRQIRKEGGLNQDIYGDIIARTRASQGTVPADGPKGPAIKSRGIVSPETMGLSEDTANRIRERNQKVGMVRLGTRLLTNTSDDTQAGGRS